MAATLLLDQTNWDLVVGSDGNIAVASEPYSLSQDAASAIKTFLGECYLDTSVGVPYFRFLGKNVPLTRIKQYFIEAALTVPNVVSAQVFFSSLTDRTLRGQVQVISRAGEVSQAPFAAAVPQGLG